MYNQNARLYRKECLGSSLQFSLSLIDGIDSWCLWLPQIHDMTWLNSLALTGLQVQKFGPHAKSLIQFLNVGTLVAHIALDSPITGLEEPNVAQIKAAIPELQHRCERVNLFFNFFHHLQVGQNAGTSVKTSGVQHSPAQTHEK